MAPTLKIVVAFLATLQLAQLAFISNYNYDTNGLNSPLNNEFTFHSRFSVLSTLKTKQSTRQKQNEQTHLNVDRGSVSSFRSKRQLDQNSETDAEIISNDPKMFSYGKSMPMTTADDELDSHQNENLGSDAWDEDVDTSHKNSLEDKPEEQSDVEESKHSFQDISLAPVSSASEPARDNSPLVPSLHPDSQEGNTKSSSLKTDPESQDSDHIGNDDHDKEDEVLINKEHSTQSTQELIDAKENFGTNDHHKKNDALQNEEEGKDVVIAESETHKNEMGKDEVDSEHEETRLSGGTKGNVDPRDSVSEQILSKELDIDDNDGELSEHFDNEDAEVFMHIPMADSGSKASSGQLKVPDGESVEEGSGDMESDPTGSHETHDIHTSVATNNTANHSVEIPPTMDSINFNIDSDSDKAEDSSEYIDEDEKETEAPIADPTEIGLIVDIPSKPLVPWKEHEDEELPIPDPGEEYSKIDDEAVTYDPKTIVDPFNIDNASEITRNIGKAIGIIDSSEETIEGEESEGSGNSFLFNDTEVDKNSLENGAMFKIDPNLLHEDMQPEDNSDSTTTRGGSSNLQEVTEEPALVHHDNGQLNAERNPGDDDDDTGEITETPGIVTGGGSTSPSSAVSPYEEVIEATQMPPEHGPRLFETVSIAENGSAFALPAGINEMGIQKSEKTATVENAPETSSSSTGSFIVLGAIMATIVALLGYSVIKSHRQKRQNARRTPRDDMGTELKEIDTLLTGSNGHGPANRLLVESDRLLTPGGEDKLDSKPDTRYPIYQNGIHGENGIVGKPNNVLQVEDPNDLSEVKIKPLNATNLDASNTQVANGVGSKNSPKSSPANNRGSRNYVTKPETAKIKMFIDHDSIPKTPIVIVKRGPANV